MAEVPFLLECQIAPGLLSYNISQESCTLDIESTNVPRKHCAALLNIASYLQLQVNTVFRMVNHAVSGPKEVGKSMVRHPDHHGQFRKRDVKGMLLIWKGRECRMIKLRRRRPSRDDILWNGDDK